MLQVEEGEARAPLAEKAVNPVAVEAARQQLQLPQVLQPYDRVLKGIQIICAKRFIVTSLFFFGSILVSFLLV